ncbi:hypothetical protein D1839_17855 [Roseburia sp. 1XD42-34]|nr:hypothetical protein [Roseburia sp. 1XD42-34]RKI74819.1 hypothetical protein D7V87_17935 [Clostridium sp. 1xD42-85]
MPPFSTECFVPQGNDPKALERIGHLGAVISRLDLFVFTSSFETGCLTAAPYMLDKHMRY